MHALQHDETFLRPGNKLVPPAHTTGVITNEIREALCIGISSLLYETESNTV